LFAASSSPLPWCTKSFSIIGFSLGGGITMDFAATFPHLIRSVALLAPAGLIRELPDAYVSFRQAARDGKSDAELNDMLAGVLGVGEDEDSQDDVVANAAALLRWQYENHQVSVSAITRDSILLTSGQGHATSFVSTLLNGPVQGQHEIWREACKVLSEKQLARESKEKLVAICGSSDTVVRPEHVKEDLDGMIGPENYVYQTVEGGHGFLLDQDACEQVVQTLVREWNL
jgi:pimeloyl-ACP methyl ester carboxylesterase